MPNFTVEYIQRVCTDSLEEVLNEDLLEEIKTGIEKAALRGETFADTRQFEQIEESRVELLDRWLRVKGFRVELVNVPYQGRVQLRIGWTPPIPLVP